MNNLSNIAKFTVTQLNNSIKNLIENNYPVISVAGEISQVKKHSSGHIYFSMKDEESLISVICWKSVVPKLKINVEEGIKVVIKGKVTTYSIQSKYQLIVQQMEYEGEGSLLKVLEERKKKLASEGFFDTSRKKNIPLYPENIGVITSDSGVVIKDIKHRISDRFPTNIIIFPANVQGEKSARDIINGINYFNKSKKKIIDLIIIARGGGSLEDLMPFNEEELVKRIYESEIPIISAVGHETDFTLCDLASDLRAPTPTAAAEMAVPDRKEIIVRLNDWENILKKNFVYYFEKKKINLEFAKSKIPDLEETINEKYQNIDHLYLKLNHSLGSKLKNSKIVFFELLERFSPYKLHDFIKFLSIKLSSEFDKIRNIIDRKVGLRKERLFSINRELSILSYKQTLNRGFAVIRKNKSIVCSDSEIKKDQEIEIEFLKDKTLAKKI